MTWMCLRNVLLLCSGCRNQLQCLPVTPENLAYTIEYPIKAGNFSTPQWLSSSLEVLCCVSWITELLGGALNFTLRVIKHNTRNTCGDGSVAPRMLDLDTECILVTNFTLWSFSLEGRDIGILRALDWVHSEQIAARWGKKKYMTHYRKRTPIPWSSSLVTIFTTLFGLPGFRNKHFKSWRAE